MIQQIKWEERKTTNPEETMNMFCTLNKKDLIQGGEEVAEQEMNPTSDL